MKSEFLNDVMEVRSKKKIDSNYLNSMQNLINNKYASESRNLRARKQNNCFIFYDKITNEAIKMKIEA